MDIGVISSMQNWKQMLQVCEELRKLGHRAFTTDLIEAFTTAPESEWEAIKIRQKNEQDAMREFWRKMQGADAVLVVNLTKDAVGPTIVNYIGCNTLMEMSWAHVLGMRIYVYNPLPDLPYIATELAAMKPIVINGDLTKIPLTRGVSPDATMEYLVRFVGKPVNDPSGAKFSKVQAWCAKVDLPSRFVEAFCVARSAHCDNDVHDRIDPDNAVVQNLWRSMVVQPNT